MYRPQAKLIILILTGLTLVGCSGTRAYRTPQVLINKNEIYQDTELLKNDPVNFIITTPANKKFLGIPIKRILYEKAHPEPEEKFDAWLSKKDNRKKRLNRLLSPKQVLALKNYTVKFNDWLNSRSQLLY